MADLASCVRSLHAASVCHADIKQRNIMRRKGKIVLVDLDAATPWGYPC